MKQTYIFIVAMIAFSYVYAQNFDSVIMAQEKKQLDCLMSLQVVLCCLKRFISPLKPTLLKI
ncbi:MAG: hypothetical protein LBR17_06490 [Bacteroidales bacterium]|nr:hypothetical protein [Bacteroidales bacterium]